MAGNFFERQASARRSSRRLVLLFALAVLAIAGAVSVVVLGSLAIADSTALAREGGLLPWLAARLPLLLGCVLVTTVLILLASLWRMRSLRRGGAEVARLLGGREITAQCEGRYERRLRNVVEELAIAACLPVPAIFVLDEERGINAFAAGYSPSDAAIAVTRGALERLNRDELQGVVAHEFSHILNGDMRLNLRLMGVLFGILMIGLIGRKMLEHGRGARSRDAAPHVVAALALTAIGYLGVFAARLIKAGVSRSREVLADASAVQFTRQSQGLAGALKKIAGLGDGSGMQHVETEEVSHMLFGEWRSYSRWLATHPPLSERIRMLDPSFSEARLQPLVDRWQQQLPDGLQEDLQLGLDGSQSSLQSISLPPADLPMRPHPGSTSARIAAPVLDDAKRASGLHHAMPDPLMRAARDGQRAGALMLALLLDRDRAVLARQLAEIASAISEDEADAVGELVTDCHELHPALRLPLAALAFPALRRRRRDDLQALVACADRLVHIDGKVSLFDYCLSRMLQVQVVEALDPSRYRAVGRRKLVDCRAALADLFATLVSHGYDDPEPMRRAYVAGLVAVLPQQRFEFAPPRAWIDALDRALAELDQLDGNGKLLLVEGMVIAISHDGRITVAEAELLRTVCACLHCPLPPVVEQRGRLRG